MFGPKLNTVFRSRWNALFWAAFVMLTAYCSVPEPDNGSTADSAEAEKIAKLVATATGQKPAEKQSGHHANPWAKKPD